LNPPPQNAKFKDLTPKKGGIAMQSVRKQEELIMQEIMAFPRKKLPQVARLLRLLRQEFISETDKQTAHSNATWEKSLIKFSGSVSSTDSFMARKAEEKALER
jgi:hypothetical protein